MKDFLHWLFTTSNGVLIYILVKYLILNGENNAAQLSFLFCLTCVSALCLLTANNYKLHRKK
jgi:uncharacterized membrane protein SirB2